MRKIIHVWSCDRCGDMLLFEDTLDHVKAAPCVFDPTGWSVVNNKMICPKHTIKVE